MPWALFSWLFCFALQSGLIGIVFYTLIQLYDFEEDLINNSDCAKRCNRWVALELGVQLSVLAVSLLSGHLVTALLSAVGSGLIIHRHVIGKQLLDPLELWKQLPQARLYTYFKMASFAVTFVFITFRMDLTKYNCTESSRAGSDEMIEIVVHEVLSDHGRHLLKVVYSGKVHDFQQVHVRMLQEAGKGWKTVKCNAGLSIVCQLPVGMYIAPSGILSKSNLIEFSY